MGRCAGTRGGGQAGALRKDRGVATIVLFYVVSELKTPLKNILGFSLGWADQPARGHLLGPPLQALKSGLCRFGVRSKHTDPPTSTSKALREPGTSTPLGQLSPGPHPGTCCVNPAATTTELAPEVSKEAVAPGPF